MKYECSQGSGHTTRFLIIEEGVKILYAKSKFKGLHILRDSLYEAAMRSLFIAVYIPTRLKHLNKTFAAPIDWVMFC